MWVVIENGKIKKSVYFKNRFIKYWIYVIVNKIKGNEVYVINEKDI